MAAIECSSDKTPGRLKRTLPDQPARLALGPTDMSKKAATRELILDQALDLTSEVGLEGLTFGVLAKRVGMSKSGLYAHFQSKESLQCQVLDAAAQRFIDDVIAPTLKQARGLPRLRTLFDLWMMWETELLSGGCPFVAAATEFDDREGPVRRKIVGHLRDMLGVISRAAKISIEEGHLRSDLNAEQFAYEFWAALLAYHQFGRLFQAEDARDKAYQAFENLIKTSSSQS